MSGPLAASAFAQARKSARDLLVETALPVIQVAYAGGFQSVRRFNAAFRACYQAAPTTLRRARSA
jgi:AraC family transcriptional regulator of adaptative response / DNA-3-methyladenine glycosylase II